MAHPLAATRSGAASLAAPAPADSVLAVHGDGTTHLGPPADPIDFYAFAGPMQPEQYDYTDDLMKLVGKDELQDQLLQLPRPTLTVVGSSTERDLQGDRMTLSALEDMKNCDANQSIWLNHDYMLPGSLFGSLQGQPSILLANGLADLRYRTDVEVLNRDAVTTWLYIQRGRRIGSSVGVMVLALQLVDARTGEAVDENDVDFWDIISGAIVVDITHVRMVEQSIVGIPANQRSWVENAIKGVFQRTHNPTLAPIVRGLFPERYANILSGVSDPKLRQQLSEVKPRTAPAARVYWVPGAAPAQQFQVQQGKRMRTTSREAVAALLAGLTPTTLTAAPAPTTAPVRAAATLPPEVPVAAMPDDVMEPPTAAAVVSPDAAPMTALEVEVQDLLLAGVAADANGALVPDAAKDATGKSDWPLGERDAAWDGGAAHSRIVEWAGGADDPDVGKLRSVHFYSPGGDDGKSVSKYKLLFCDVVGGSVKAMPRALMACWGGHGVDQTTGIPDDEKAAIKKKLSAYAARMREAFDDDDIMPPWDKEDAATPDMTAAQATPADPTLDVTPKASRDGTHAPFTGSHSHPHTAMGEQGGDDMHEHEHSHDGDSNHAHVHADSGAPDNTLAEGDVAVGEDGTHAATSGTHTHDHQDGQGGLHGHAYEGDADHGHTAAAPTPTTASESAPTPTAATIATAAAVTTAEAVVEAAQAALLATYQQVLGPLGFTVSLTASGGTAASDMLTSDAVPDAQKCSWSDQQQYQIAQGLVAIDAMVDGLLCSAGIEDRDNPVEGADYDNDGDEDDADDDQGSGGTMLMPLLGYSLSMLSRGLRRYSVLARKEGRRHSEADMAHLQAIHDACMSLTDGAVCKGAVGSETADGAGTERNQQQGQDANGGNGNPSRDADEALTMALGAEHLRTLATDSTTWLAQLGALTQALTTLPDLEARAKTLTETIAAYQRDALAYGTEVEQMRQQVARLKEMPLPRPTHQQRSVTPTDPGLAGFDDFLGLRAAARPVAYPNLTAPGDPATVAAAPPAAYTALDQAAATQTQVAAALAQTSLERRAADNRLCRHWPAGVGAGLRPSLSSDQRALMSITEWSAYDSGGDVLVPELG